MLTSPFNSWHITFLSRLRWCFSSQSFSFFGLIILPPNTTQCLTRFQSIVLVPPCSPCWATRLPPPPPSLRSFSCTSSSSLGILCMLSSPPLSNNNNDPSAIQLFSQAGVWYLDSCGGGYFIFYNGYHQLNDKPFDVVIKEQGYLVSTKWGTY